MKLNLVAALLLFAAPAFAAQQAPIPAPILSAQKVFLANGGADLESANEFQGSNQLYDSTYAALQAWGHWKLVSSPENADLVLIVRSTSPVDRYSKGMPVTHSPQIELKLLDAKTHFLLWTITQPVQSAILESTWKKNYNSAIAGLIIQLKLLTTPATP